MFLPLCLSLLFLVSTYFSIEKKTSAFYESKGSKFYAFAFPIKGEGEVKKYIETLYKKHPKATHICYAFKVGKNGSLYRAQDDGEPSGTAGKPILGQLNSFNLTFILLAVVRYYGGTKLGVSGLISAYKLSAKKVIENSTIRSHEIMTCLSVKCSFTKAHLIYNYLKTLQVNQWEESYTDMCHIQFKLPVSKQETVSLWLDQNKIQYSEC